MVRKRSEKRFLSLEVEVEAVDESLPLGNLRGGDGQGEVSGVLPEDGELVLCEADEYE